MKSNDKTVALIKKLLRALSGEGGESTLSGGGNELIQEAKEYLKSVKSPEMYNHIMDVTFEYESENEDPNEDSAGIKLAALETRVEYLREHPEEIAEAFMWSDSYLVDE